METEYFTHILNSDWLATHGLRRAHFTDDSIDSYRYFRFRLTIIDNDKFALSLLMSPLMFSDKPSMNETYAIQNSDYMDFQRLQEQQ